MRCALILMGLGILAWPMRSSRRGVGQRLRRVAGPRPEARSFRYHLPVDWARVASGAVGLAGWVVVGSAGGVVVGIVLTALADRLLRRVLSAAARRRRRTTVRLLPPVLDLLGVGLRAGLPTMQAFEVVADAFGGPIGADLRQVASLSRLGASPQTAWQRYVDDPVWGVVARAAIRAADSGSALASGFERVAEDLRAERVSAAEAISRRAGVFAMAPLGLCFLPAFVCLGVIPVVLGLLTRALH